MWIITVVRIFAVLVFGVSFYSILLWAIGLKIPGRPRRQVPQGSKYDKRNKLIVISYCLLLVFIVTIVFLLNKCFTRGEI